MNDLFFSHRNGFRRLTRSVVAVCLVWWGAAVLATPAAAAPGQADVYRLEGIINPSTADYLAQGIEASNSRGVELIVILLDTPGGLDPSMRAIVKEILNSNVPVAVYVSPRGARAASAGVFITLAAHVAAMAPGTNIGAAHPVGIGGEPDAEMKSKIENDAAAYIKSIAESRKRNAVWAEEAVRKSVSIPETKALEEGVIDLVAPDLEDLLKQIDGRRVTTAAGTVTLDTKGMVVRQLPMGFRWRMLQIISDPNVAYILMMLGILGLFFELAHPGVIFPGVAGALCLILGFYGMQTLPINYAGLLLILLAVVLFIAEIKITSYGLLTVGGVIAMLLGSLMLIDSSAPFLRISLSVILAATAVAVFFFIVLAGAVVRAYRRRPTTGREGLVGSIGEAMTDLTPKGRIFIHGEIWDANCSAGARAGDRVKVVRAEGLTLEVKPITEKE